MEENKEIVKVEENSGRYIAPVANIQEALERYELFREFRSKILESGKDYGEIPGTSKPTLLKPGAEKLGTFFGLFPKYPIIEIINDWTGKDHNGEPFFFYHYKCQLFRNEKFIGESLGSCNSWEKKFRYRWINELEIPSNVDKSGLEFRDGAISEFAFAVEKAETTGKYGKPASYWQQFADAIANGTAKQIKRKTKKGDEMDAWEIGGKLYAVPNKDVTDQVNTIDKMAQKRAFVAAILIATNASDYFTQDMEDFQGISYEPIIEGSFEETENKSKQNQKPVGNKRPYDPETLKSRIATFAEKHMNDTASEDQRGLMVGGLNICYAGEGADMKRHEALQFLTGEASSKKLSDNYVLAILDWLHLVKDSGGAYIPDEMAVREAQTLLTFARTEAGQQDLFDEKEK
jgi:hypothetical protein